MGKGELEGVEGVYRSIKLETPLAPGGVYAFSVDVSELGVGSMDLWGEPVNAAKHTRSSPP